jgi:hypothetical protein
MKSYIESRRKGLPHTKYKEESLTGLAISCLETALYNKLFKDKCEKGQMTREDETEDVNSYCMTLRKRKDAVN